MAQIYRICIEGHLDGGWSDWFDGLMIIYDTERDVTCLIGPVVDQPALFGLLLKLNDLNLPLLSVNRMGPHSPAASWSDAGGGRRQL